MSAFSIAQSSEAGFTWPAFLFLLAVLPAVVLCVYIYKKDRVEKEPIGLLLAVLALGVAVAFPAGWVESGFDKLLKGIFGNYITVNAAGDMYLPSSLYHLYNIIKNFIGIALVEEFAKWIIVYLVIRKNRNFNSTFDGVLYAVFASLGFALIENVLYAFSYGYRTALARAVTSVPGHMFNGVFMGFYLSAHKFYTVKSDLEVGINKHSKSALSRQRASFYLALSVIVPVLMHGFYDLTLSFSSPFMLLVFYVYLILLYISGFRRVAKMSRADNYITATAAHAILKENPDIRLQ